MFTKANIHTTAKNTNLRLSYTGSVPFEKGVPAAGGAISIHPEKARQTIIGFGGAFTEAMADALSRLSPENRRKALEAYFHPQDGIGYQFCRTHINSCDFSLENYSYCEKAGDTALETFDISRDEKTLIPLIREAEAIKGDRLTLFASPWSPPAWMKTNGQMNNGGSLKPEYRDVWARYFVKYIQAYAERGIRIWGVTPQNEPLAVTRWDNCVYTHAQEREMVKALNRAFRDANLDVKIIVWDHNKDCLKERIDIIFSDLEAYDAAWGIGYHWYGATDAQGVVDNSALDYARKCYREKPLVFTEGCNPVWRYGGLENMIGIWETGEKYARHLIADLNHFTAGWCDWNMVLDERGGPNHVGNYCDAPIIADTQTDQLHFQSPYYCIGHFSKFIRPGAISLETQSDTQYLSATAARNTDGSVIAVVLNESTENQVCNITIGDEGFTTVLQPSSLYTFVLS